MVAAPIVVPSADNEDGANVNEKIEDNSKTAGD
jgi:hypothetical protein